MLNRLSSKLVLSALANQSRFIISKPLIATQKQFFACVGMHSEPLLDHQITDSFLKEGSLKAKSKLEVNLEKMKQEIKNVKTEDVIELDSSKLHESVVEARKKCAPGGFGQS